MLWKFFYAGSQIRAVQIRAMRNRASRGMTVVEYARVALSMYIVYVECETDYSTKLDAIPA